MMISKFLNEIKDYSFREIESLSNEEYLKVERRREIFLKKIDELKKEYDGRIELKINNEEDIRIVLLDWIEAKEKGKGLGTEVQNKINNLADKYRIIMTLLPDPKSKYDLRSFWKKFGFEETGDSQLWRFPK